MTRCLSRLSFAVAVGALLALPSAGAAAITVGHSGWEWGNPQPQGNTIRALEFVGNRGYAGGDFGTLLRSDDWGASWRGIRTGVTASIWRLQAIGANTVIIPGDACGLLRSNDGGQTFARLSRTGADSDCPEKIASFHFPSSRVGYVVHKDGNVFRTSDGGRGWTQKAPVPGAPATGGDSTPGEIVFVSESEGYVVTWAARGKIDRTTDGAQSWTLKAASESPLHGIYFADATTAYAVGRNGAALKSTDGGTTWTALSTGASNTLLPRIRCAGPSVCLTSGAYGGQVRTDDGGASWSGVGTLLAAAFASPTRAVAADANGALGVSNDAGTTWSWQQSGLQSHFVRLSATPSGVAYAFGPDGVLARSTDGGHTWRQLGGIPNASFIVGLSFASNEVGFAVDDRGAAYTTTNAAASWRVIKRGTRRDRDKPSAILATDDEHVLLVGARGIRRSIDGGDRFRHVRDGDVADEWYDNVDRAGRNIFAYDPYVLSVSRDGGRSWTNLPRPPGELESVDFVSREVGFALTQDRDGHGRVWRTRDGGASWRELPGVGDIGGDQVAFSSAWQGYLVGVTAFGSGSLLRTTDAGRTWRPQPIISSRLNGLLALNDSDAVAIDPEDKAIFATRTGGDAGAPSALTIEVDKRALRKVGVVTIKGRLTPAHEDERVIVSAKPRDAFDWTVKVVETDGGGKFAATFRVRKDTTFVAQWAGDYDHNGDGSPVATVRVARH